MNTIECKNLTHRYGKVEALQDVTLTIEPGHIVGLLGPNGSGKTTLIKILNGLLTPAGGSLSVCGQTVGKESHEQVSYLPERIALPLWMNAVQLMDFYQDFYSDFQPKAAQEMLERLDIPMKRPLRQMSKGTREKVQLILVMSRNAMLYLLDEPIGGVDPATRDYILNTILTNYNPQASVVISTHLIGDVEPVLDEVIFLKSGRVLLHQSVDALREERGSSVDSIFREVFKC